jgi:hypothetical protein
MKITVLVLILWVLAIPAIAQMISSSMPARLQVYGTKPDGSQALMTSDNLTVIYDQLKMMGELKLSSLVTDDESLGNLLDSAMYDIITFSGTIPEGQFVFHDVLNSKFTVEVELFYGEWQSRIIINYDVSNMKSNVANTFEINCLGSLSLKDDLGVTRETGLDDKISFQFFQSVQTKSY